MAEMHTSTGTNKYRLKKIRNGWFLENTYTRKTKRLPFLSVKVTIQLEDNLIFADDNVYEIIETDSEGIRIEKIDDLDYTFKQDVEEIYTNIRDMHIRSQEKDSSSSSFDGPYQRMQDRYQCPKEPPQAAVATCQVMMEDTKLSQSCGLKERMELRVNDSGLSFYDTKSKSIKYTYPNRWVRRYGKYGANKFCFEIGRRCPAGEGEIIFTPVGKANLHETIKHIWSIGEKK